MNLIMHETLCQSAPDINSSDTAECILLSKFKWEFAGWYICPVHGAGKFGDSTWLLRISSAAVYQNHSQHVILFPSCFHKLSLNSSLSLWVSANVWGNFYLFFILLYRFLWPYAAFGCHMYSTRHKYPSTQLLANSYLQGRLLSITAGLHIPDVGDFLLGKLRNRYRPIHIYIWFFSTSHFCSDAMFR